MNQCGWVRNFFMTESESGLETCFGCHRWDPAPRVLGAKHVSNPDVEPFWCLQCVVVVTVVVVAVVVVPVVVVVVMVLLEVVLLVDAELCVEVDDVVVVDRQPWPTPNFFANPFYQFGQFGQH